jgi:hypothetical protein
MLSRAKDRAGFSTFPALSKHASQNVLVPLAMNPVANMRHYEVDAEYSTVMVVTI